MKLLIRFLGLLIVIATGYFVLEWVQLNPGSVSVVWFGYEITASIFVVIAGLLLSFLLLHALLNGISYLANYPARRRSRKRLRDYEQGLECLTNTFSALSVNDTRNARKALGQARKHLADAPVTLLLEAQLERENADPAKRHALLEQLRQSKQTKPVAERGLIEEALHEKRLDDARELAEEAFNTRGKDSWLAMTLMDIYARQGAYNKALDTLRLARSRGIVPAGDANNYAAALRLAWVLASDDLPLQQMQLQRALKDRPQLELAVVKLAEVDMKLNKIRAAQKALERAYKHRPARALVETYRQAIAALSEAKQAKKLRALALSQPDSADSQMLLAELALIENSPNAARDFAKAALLHEERGDILELLATIEDTQENSAAANGWRQRAASAPYGWAYKCDNCAHLAAHWKLHCPECMAFDGLQRHFPAVAVIDATPVP